MSALSDLRGGLTGNDATDQGLVNAALLEVANTKEPLPHFAAALSAQYIARLLAEIVALTP